MTLSTRFALSLLLVFLSSTTYAQTCSLSGPRTVCIGQAYTYTLAVDDIDFDKLTSAAFTVRPGLDIPAQINSTGSASTFEVVWFAGGAGELEVVLSLDGQPQQICQIEVEVFGDGFFPTFGGLSSQLGDTLSACADIAVPINTLTTCTDCDILWTLNSEAIDPPLLYEENQDFTLITGDIPIEGLGDYTLCYNLTLPDESCAVEDCIVILITELSGTPTFQASAESPLCNGTEVLFSNTTLVQEDNPIRYQWTVGLDTVEWTYVSDDLVFNFADAGEYEIALQYFLADDPTCTSDISRTALSVTDQSGLPISCNIDRCDQLTRIYRTLNICSNYTWSVDSDAGTILSGQGTPEVQVEWFVPGVYTNQALTLSTAGCPTNYCTVTETYVRLYPATISVTGDRIKCGAERGQYTVSAIPDADVTWSVEPLETVTGAPPTIVPTGGYEAEVAFGNFLGTAQVTATMTFPNGDCMVSATYQTQKVSVQLNTTDECPGDAIIANVLPPLDETVTWTITDPTPTDNTVSQLASSPLFYTGTAAPGTYELSLRFDDGGERCNDIPPVNIYDVKPLILEGPLTICDGDVATYRLVGVTDADDVLWTVFRSGTATTFSGPEIEVEWPLGGFGFTIRVELTSPVAANIDCGTLSEVFTIEAVDGAENVEIIGDQVVCRDSREMYFLAGENINQPLWSVSPPYVGSIVAGDSTRQVTVQWHFADISTEAFLVSNYLACGSSGQDSIPITFRENEATILGPQELCQGGPATYRILDVDTFSMIMWYVDGELRDDEGNVSIGTLLSGLPAGSYTISVVVEDLNGCPGLTSDQLAVNVLPFPVTPALTFDQELPACIDQFENNILATLSNLDPTTTYQWYTNNVLQAEAAGAEWTYSQLLTLDDFVNKTEIRIVYVGANGCSRSLNNVIDFSDAQVCRCEEDIIGSIDYLDFVDCSTISFSGTLNWEDLSEPQLIVLGINFEYIVDITSDDDLSFDSLLLEGDLGTYSVGFRNGCPGVLIDLCTGDTIDSETCIASIDTLIFDPIGPSVEFTTECDEDINYTVTAIESLSQQLNPPINFDISWAVGGQSYEEDTLILLGVPADSLLEVLVTVENLNANYSCTENRRVRTPDFDPKIEVVAGPCGDDTWEVQPTTDVEDVFDVFWDFSDGSGSTLYSTEKAFDADEDYLITMTVTSFDGCVATDTLTPFIVENTLDGILSVDDGPCQDSAVISYISLSDRPVQTYEWTNGVTTNTPDLVVTNAGLYGVVVLDEFACRLELDPVAVEVNRSFPLGIIGRREACGNTSLRVTPVVDYRYQWLVDGEVVSEEASLILTEPGVIEVSVISIANSTNEACDTLTTTVELFPLPALPAVISTSLYCDPPLVEYTVTNYDSVVWAGSNIITQEGPSIQIAQNGTYRARYIDENGCSSTRQITQNENPVDFDLMADYCIQYCREDLDSLAITIEGVPGSYATWAWTTFDSGGQPSTIAAGTGSIDPIVLDETMYDLLLLEVETDSCSYRMDPIFLDIVNCEEPPVLPCLTSATTISLAECLLDAQNGGPLYDLVVELTIPEGYTLCDEDSISVVADLGTLLDTEYTVLGDSLAPAILQISTGLLIDSVEQYLSTGLELSTTYCDSEGTERCVLYPLILDSCIVPPLDTCLVVNDASHECGLLDFQCIRSAEYGGVRFLFTSRLRVSPAYEMCDPEVLDLTFNAGTIHVLKHHRLTALNGDLLVEYEAVVDIENDSLYRAGGAYIGAVFCSTADGGAQCIDYLFPFTSCTYDFDCGATYSGMDYSPYGVEPEMLYYTYCLTLSDVVTEQCQLSQYEIVATILGDELSKEVLREVYVGTFDTVYCIQLPILEADFESSDYYCLEIEIAGDCPIAQCGYYDCSMLMPNSMRSANNSRDQGRATHNLQSTSKTTTAKLNSAKVSIYPNPAIHSLQVAVEGQDMKEYELHIYSAGMQTVARQHMQSGTHTIPVETWPAGLYMVTVSDAGRLLFSERVIVVR